MKRKTKIKSNDGKMWATVQKKNYGFLILSGRARDGKNHGHFEIYFPGNNLGTRHLRGFIKEIRRQDEIIFSDPERKKTRIIRIKIDKTGSIKDFAFIEK